MDSFRCEGCPFPPFTYNVAASPDNQKIYVEVMFDFILVIDATTRQIIDTIAPREPSGVSQLKIQREPHGSLNLFFREVVMQGFILIFLLVG